jgi:biopolymer transport protein ExbB
MIVFSLTVMLLATTAMAQDGADAGAATATSYFEMFVGLTSDWLGRLITWFLILTSICGVALIILFFMQMRRANIIPEGAVAEVEGMLSDRKYRDAIAHCEQEPSVFGEVMHAALSEASNGYGAMERAVEETADLASSRKIRSIEVLNVFGAVGPMIGLFGTVYGMIVAFRTIEATQGKASPSELAAGISTALVTTFWGLIVGIPAVAAAALVRNRIDALVTEAMVEAEALIGRFRPGGSARKPASGDRASSGKSGTGASPKPKAE